MVPAAVILFYFSCEDKWVKKCMEHEVQGSRPRGRPEKRLYVKTVKHVS